MRFQLVTLSVLLSLGACGDDDGAADAASDVGSSDAATTDAFTEGDAGGSDAGGSDSGVVDVGVDAPPTDAAADAGAVECDYRSVDGVVVIEAEDLPLTGDWEIASDEDGAVGSYIQWTGAPSFGDPSNGVMQMQVQLTEPGRYRLQWRTRIGRGSDATEHNDTWVRFPDVDGFLGAKGPVDDERRVYPRPLCDDAAFVSATEAMSNVASVDCPEGPQRDGWFKVYSSGARDWMWSTFTNDRDGFGIFVEVDEPGVYLFEMAARSDYSLIDQIILHHEDVSSDDARGRAGTTTECP